MYDLFFANLDKGFDITKQIQNFLKKFTSCQPDDRRICQASAYAYRFFTSFRMTRSQQSMARYHRQRQHTDAQAGNARHGISTRHDGGTGSHHIVHQEDMLPLQFGGATHKKISDTLVQRSNRPFRVWVSLNFCLTTISVTTGIPVICEMPSASFAL